MNKCISVIHRQASAHGRKFGLFLATIIFGVILLLTPSVARAEENVHIVRRGESLGMIAQQHGVSVRNLIRYNELNNPNILVTGQQIRIPDEEAILAIEADKVAEAETESLVDGVVDTEAAEVAEMPSEEVVAVEEDSAASVVVAEIDEALATAATLPGDDGYHFVRYNDSLFGIAKSYNMTLADLMRLNDISDPNLLHVGQQLRVSVRVPALNDEEEERQPYPATEIHIVQLGETIKQIASDYGMAMEDLMMVNGLPHERFLHPGQRLRIQSILPRSIINMGAAPEDGKRWIEIDIANQMLTAWQGDVAVLQTIVSTGKASTPTVKGNFVINRKYDKQRMIGADYNIPNVPSVMYFYSGYAIHGAYWEPPFGTPSSHGCVNVRPSEAAILFDWADTGTEIWVHE